MSQWDNRRASDMVEEFHKAYNLPIRYEPELPGSDERTLRRTLLSEEYWEYVEAEDKNNIVGIADALADMIYIIHGTAIVYGIPLDAVFEEVHKSNMSKLEEGKPLYRSDGKVLKGSNFQEPKIEEILNGKTGNVIRED